MYRIKVSSQYKRSIRKLSKSGNFPREEINKVIQNILDGNTLPAKYKNHQLKGDFLGFMECHIKPDLLLVYKIEKNNLVLFLLDIGSHSYLFG